MLAIASKRARDEGGSGGVGGGESGFSSLSLSHTHTHSFSLCGFRMYRLSMQISIGFCSFPPASTLLPSLSKQDLQQQHIVICCIVHVCEKISFDPYAPNILLLPAAWGTGLCSPSSFLLLLLLFGSMGDEKELVLYVHGGGHRTKALELGDLAIF